MFGIVVNSPFVYLPEACTKQHRKINFKIEFHRHSSTFNHGGNLIKAAEKHAKKSLNKTFLQLEGGLNVHKINQGGAAPGSINFRAIFFVIH